MEASIGCAAGDGMGGGIFAKTAKTPPLQSGVCGDFIAIRIAPKGTHCRRHARAMPPMENHVFITEVEWEGWIPGGGRPFAAAPFGIRRFKPILPFLGGRSDAARRVVFYPSRRFPLA